MKLFKHLLTGFLAITCVISVGQAEDNPSSNPLPDSTTTLFKSLPFGSTLFEGRVTTQESSILNPDYIITSGDKVSLHIWGAIQADEVTTVDPAGNLFLPEIGAVKVGGLKNSDLLATVKNKLSGVYKDGVEAYVNLLTTSPLNVFITGPVLKPGQYSGAQSDSIISFLQRAGGILPNQGSYRKIQVIRNSRPIVNIDLYAFLRYGQLPKIQFENNDTILVSPVHQAVSVQGDVRGNYRFEFSKRNTLGRELVEISRPHPSVTNVALSGSRNSLPWSAYLTLREFAQTELLDGDIVRFVTDSPSPTIGVTIEGSHLGNSNFPVIRGARLQELLDYVAISPDEADIKNIYIKRRSTAKKQRESLNDSLDRLERSIMTSPARSDAEANIRKQESALIREFIKQARQVETEGRIVVSENNSIANIRLEDGDVIVIPFKSDIVTISGEVQMPQSTVYATNLSTYDYIHRAGGFSERGDAKNIIIKKANGQVTTQTELISAGDEIIVLPRIDTKGFQFAKDILTIIFQVAATSKAVGIL